MLFDPAHGEKNAKIKPPVIYTHKCSSLDRHESKTHLEAKKSLNMCWYALKDEILKFLFLFLL
jgi:hypothetical protein